MRITNLSLYKKFAGYYSNLDLGRQRQLTAAGFVLIFAVGGTLLILASHADTSITYASLNASNGTRCGGVSVITDGNASNGSAVQFGSTASNACSGGTIGSMPLISRGVPAWSNGYYTNGGLNWSPDRANSNDYKEYGASDYGFISAQNFNGDTQTGTNDAWIAYNLSAVPAVEQGKLTKIYTTWYDSPIYDYDTGVNGATTAAFGDPSDYTIDLACETAANSTPTSSAPAVNSPDWVNAVTVSNNFLSSRSHIIGMTDSGSNSSNCGGTYNWIRINITGVVGGNNGAQLKWDIWDASQSSSQSFLFLGDSITNVESLDTQLAAGNDPTSGQAYYGGYDDETPAQQINTWNSNDFPSIESAAIGGKTAVQYNTWTSNQFNAYDGALNTTLTTGLSTGQNITTLPLASLTNAFYSGAIVQVTSGSHSQQWTVSTNVSIPNNPYAAASLPVDAQTPNFAYPAGSTVTVVYCNGDATCAQYSPNSVPWLPKSPAHNIILALGTNDCNGFNFGGQNTPYNFNVDDRSTWEPAAYQFYDDLTGMIKQAMTGPVDSETAPGDPSNTFLSSREVIIPTLPASIALRSVVGPNNATYSYNVQYETPNATSWDPETFPIQSAVFENGAYYPPNSQGQICNQLIKKVVSDEENNTVDQQYFNGATQSVVQLPAYDASSFGTRVIDGPDLWADTDDTALVDGTATWDNLPNGYAPPATHWGDQLHPYGDIDGQGFVRGIWAQWIENNIYGGS